MHTRSLEEGTLVIGILGFHGRPTQKSGFFEDTERGYVAAKIDVLD